MVHLRPVRARVPRRRAVRARVVVLEDVLGSAGDGQGSTPCDESAWARFMRCKPRRGRAVRVRGRVVYAAARCLIRSKKRTQLADDSARRFACEAVDDARADDHGRVELEVEAEDEAGVENGRRAHFGFGSTASWDAKL